MKFSELPYARPDTEAAKTEFAALTDALRTAGSYAEAKAVFLKKEALERHIDTLRSLASIRHSIDTRDEFYDGEKLFWNKVLPELAEYEQAWSMAMLESPFRADFEREYGSITFLTAEIELKAFSPASSSM